MIIQDYLYDMFFKSMNLNSECLENVAKSFNTMVTKSALEHLISEECLYIGMLYNNLTTGKRDFRYISNFGRLQSFDDEADIDFIKAYLEGIKQQVENNIFNFLRSAWHRATHPC